MLKRSFNDNIKSMWILENGRREISAFYGIALMLIITSFWWQGRPVQTLLALFVGVMIDNAHVYATAWRSWFDKNEMKRSKRFHFLTLLFVFLAIFTWCAAGIPWFWSFVLYFTVFHHVRQYYGVHRWSLALNHNKGPNAATELYAFTILPFIGYHFRSDISYQGFFSDNDMWLFPNETLLTVVYFLLAMFIVSFFYKIFRQRNSFSWPVFSTVIFPLIINIFCFLITKDFFVALLPILAIHGMTYFHLSSLAQRKVRQGFWHNSPMLGLMLIIFVSGLFGVGEAWLTDSQIDVIDSESYKGNFLMAFGVAIVTTPAIYHYIVDSVLWKKTHPDFKTIMAKD